MAQQLQIVVCAGIVPDPLQTLEPVSTPTGPGIKNELVLPAVLDPWASSALYEAASLAAKNSGSKLWLVAIWWLTSITTDKRSPWLANFTSGQPFTSAITIFRLATIRHAL